MYRIHALILLNLLNLLQKTLKMISKGSHLIFFLQLVSLSLCLPVWSADTCSLGKQFGPRSGSKLFDILMVFMKYFFQKVNFEKNQQRTKNMKNYPICNELMNSKIHEHSCKILYFMFFPFFFQEELTRKIRAGEITARDRNWKYHY